MATHSDIEKFENTGEEDIVVPAIDVMSLFAQTPPGHWMAVSNDGKRVVAYAKDLKTAMDDAKRKGESRPIAMRHPEEITFIY